MLKSSSTKRKWFTCTPVRFFGDHTFFARDSGLLCMGFQEIGVPCKAIMPGPEMEGDQVNDLIRTEYTNLEDPKWWKSLEAEGVVLYAWGDGKYWKIARAIQSSGAKLVTHMDTAGILGIFNGLDAFVHSLWHSSISKYGWGIRALILTALRFAYAGSVGLIKNDYRRVLHLNYADIIGVISPIAADRIHKVCHFYGGDEMTSKIKLIPHPNASYMIFNPDISKERMVCAIGRWDDEVTKGTALLCQTVELLTIKDERVQIEIYGRVPQSMSEWHSSLSEAARRRVLLKGVVPNRKLKTALQRARVSICTSYREGYHTVSAEALCCGCSITGPDVESIPSLKWFTDGPHGDLAARNEDALADCLIDELSKWDSGERDAAAISKKWTARLHTSNVARQIIDLALD